ncbi:MAG: NUDIX domain-containing protein [Rubrivivax sp.]|nr:NUDIX domain-containing protein [Rubrivivax sp.]
MVEVAVGVLLDAEGPEGRFLLTSRPAGKAYAGYWEFPGGKVEAGESVEAALARELHEELGIDVEPAQVKRWQVEVFDYPHALVRLNFCKVFAWRGAFVMREGQQMAWQALPVQVAPVLPGTVPVLRRFAAERGFTGATHDEGTVPAKG